MKKHLILISSVLLVGTVLTVGANEVSAKPLAIASTKKAARGEVEFFEGGVGYKTDVSLAPDEVKIFSHYTNILPENIVIPAKITNTQTGKAYTVVSVGKQSLSLGPNETDIVKSIQLPNTIKTIEEQAFVKRGELETVTMSEGVTSIGEQAFFKNKSLKTINLPSTLTSIGDYAFSGNTSLKTINLPTKLKSIGRYSFNDCSSLESIKIPSSVGTLSDYSFRGTTSLTSVDIETGITTIGAGVFQNASALTAITIPNSVTSIGNSAFNNASSLKTVNLPTNLTEISNALFKGCQSLNTIVIPDSVSTITSNAFTLSGLTEITMPKGITKRADLQGQSIYAPNLEKITFTSPIKEMATNVFMAPIKKGYIFEGWLEAGKTEVVTHNGLSEVANRGNATVTAQWKVDPNADGKGVSDATITLLDKQETGAVSFGNVVTDAKIVFKEVTLKGSEAATTTEDTTQTNAKVVVNDTRSDKTKGWSVFVNYQNTNFADKGLNLTLKPTAPSGTAKEVTLSTTQATFFEKGSAQADKYDIKLNPLLAIPANYSVTANNQVATKINWLLIPEV